MKSFFLLVIMICLTLMGYAKKIKIGNNEAAYKTVALLQPGDSLIFKDGLYKDIQLLLTATGSSQKSIVVMAETPGKVIFCGDAKVAIYGAYTEINGFYFTHGNRNLNRWKSHGPGLIAIYASHCRITNCAFNNFDEANSAYITTSLDNKGNVPTHCRIDHCSFTNKLTFDQVINLNNRNEPDKTNPVIAPAMYHRVDHCFFSNPKKKGNAGGGIRIGYYRNALGRCLIDSNVFIRQDSEAEIITSKSMENVFYANTFLNCQGTLNFRHGDKQVAINNFFLSDDEKFKGYGGIFIWGSKHIVAGNYFSLSETLEARGNAAIYLNPGSEGSEHALAFGSIIANNVFANNNGYAIHFNPMEEQRRKLCKENNTVFELPHNITFAGNFFWANKNYSYTFLKDDYQEYDRKNTWLKNFFWGNKTGLYSINEIEEKQIDMQLKKGFYFLQQINTPKNILGLNGIYNRIAGIEIDFDKAISSSFLQQPVDIKDILPAWMFNYTGDYYITGKLSHEMTERLNRISLTRTNE